jgi:hypothetical protein
MMLAGSFGGNDRNRGAVLGSQLARQVLQFIPATRKQHKAEPIDSQYARKLKADPS